MALTRIRSDCQVWNMFKIWTHAPRASWSSHFLPQTKPNPEICCFTYYGILCSSYYPPSPFFGQKLCGRVFIYSIRPPFTTRLLPVLYAATMIAGKQIFHMLMALRKADFGIPAETVSYVCRSLVTVLQQASLFLKIWRHMALPDQDHAIFCQ